MDDKEFKRLEHNLSRSALKAKPFYVRGMIGLTETDQGYFSIVVAPVYNPFTQKEEQLASVLEGLEGFYKEYKDTKEELVVLSKQFETYKQQQEDKEKIAEKKYQELLKRIQDLELLTLD